MAHILKQGRRGTLPGQQESESDEESDSASDSEGSYDADTSTNISHINKSRVVKGKNVVTYT